MTFHFLDRPHPGIQTLTPYVPGKSIETVAKKYGITDSIKLARNENHRGCSPKLMQALAALRPHQIATYLAPSHPFPSVLAHKLRIRDDMLTVSNESDDTLTSLEY